MGVCFDVLTAPRRVQDDPASLVISYFAESFYVLVPVALWFARPRRVDSAVVEPVAQTLADFPSGPRCSARSPAMVAELGCQQRVTIWPQRSLNF